MKNEVIPKRGDEGYFSKLEMGKTQTLHDAQTTLVVQAQEEMYLITVDRGIVKNTKDGVRKSDFISYGMERRLTHLIELKGRWIEEAYKQLEQTIRNLNEDESYRGLVKGRDRLDAYIVSPSGQNIPAGQNLDERKLAQLLARRSVQKTDNILDLIQYVRVVPKQRKVSCKDRRIICSAKAPLPLM